MFEMIPFNRGNRVSVYNPFRMLDELEKTFFGPSMNFASAAGTPFRTDIRENDEEYTLDADLPGFAKEDISIDVEGDQLTVKAEHKSETEAKDDKTNYVRRERTYGAYARSFDISGVDADKITAKYENGVLTLHLPKLAPVTPPSRRLEIN